MADINDLPAWALRALDPDTPMTEARETVRTTIFINTSRITTSALITSYVIFNKVVIHCVAPIILT